MNLFKVAQHTFREIYYERVIFVGAFSSALLLLVTYVSAEFGYGPILRILLDVGMGICSLTSSFLAIYLGNSIVRNEIDRKTLYMVLSRPIKRESFLMGKMLGVALILALNLGMLMIVLLTLFKVYGGTTSSQFYWCCFFIYVENLLLMCLSSFLSLISNRIITILATVTMWLMGYSASALLGLSAVKNNKFLVWLIMAYSDYMPNFDKINIKKFILHETFLPQSFLYTSTAYSVLWIGLIALASCLVFRKKELV